MFLITLRLVVLSYLYAVFLSGCYEKNVDGSVIFFLFGLSAGVKYLNSLCLFLVGGVFI